MFFTHKCQEFWIPASAGMTTMTITPAQVGTQAAVLVTAGHFLRRS